MKNAKNTTAKENVKSEKELTIETIAMAYFGVETLETRKMDSLDFYDCAVWQIKAAINSAYNAGMKAAQAEKNKKKTP